MFETVQAYKLWYLNTFSKNDVISFFRKRFCA